MNNTTYCVSDQRRKYIVRIYNNHCDPNKLKTEHQMLTALQSNLVELQVPKLTTNRDHSTITTLKNGKLGARFAYIEGERPNSSNSIHRLSLVEATAYLSVALSRITIEDKGAYSPYYQLEHNYPAFDNMMLERLLQQQSLQLYKEQLLLVQAERKKLEQLANNIASLPHQWIHGDINCSNALAVKDQVTAILDFEFVTRDLRVMELAVVMNECLESELHQPLHIQQLSLQQMIETYDKIAPLTKEEKQWLYPLIKLRSVDVVMHFIVRFLEGLDNDEVLIRIISAGAQKLHTMNNIMN